VRGKHLVVLCLGLIGAFVLLVLLSSGPEYREFDYFVR